MPKRSFAKTFRLDRMIIAPSCTSISSSLPGQMPRRLHTFAGIATRPSSSTTLLTLIFSRCRKSQCPLKKFFGSRASSSSAMVYSGQQSLVARVTLKSCSLYEGLKGGLKPKLPYYGLMWDSLFTRLF